MYDYFVVGDFEINGKAHTCLIKMYGGNEQLAVEGLAEVKRNPPEDCLGNIRLEKEKKENCWWNQGGLD